MAAEQATDGKAAPEVGKPQVFRSPSALVVWIVWLLFAVANLVDLAVQGRDHFSLVAAGILVMITGVAYVGAQRPRVIAEDEALIIRNPLRDHRIRWPNITRVDVSDLLRVHCRLPGPARSKAEVAGRKEKKERVVTAWAVHYSRRRQLAYDVKMRRDSLRAGGSRGRRTGGVSAFGIPQPTSRRPVSGQSTSYGAAASAPIQEAEALKVVRLLNDRVAAAGIERATEQDAGQDTILTSLGSYESAALAESGPLLTSTWSWRAIVALVIPALVLLIVLLV
ncbi:MAG TPA: PH domain-containing protein [Streptosporangiaceae bacterium]|jgi:hypothetical protein